MWSRLYDLVERVSEVLLLSLLVGVLMLPIVTAGAAITAGMGVCLKVIFRGEGQLWKEFWRIFQTVFLPATLIWGIYLGVNLLGIYELLLLPGLTGGVLVIAMRGLLWGVLLLALLTVGWIFPLLAKAAISPGHELAELIHGKTTGLLLAKSFVFAGGKALRYLPYNLPLLVIWAVPLYFALQSLKTLLIVAIPYLAFGLGISIYLHVLILRKKL